MVRLLVQLGRARAGQGDPQGAERYYRRSIDLAADLHDERSIRTSMGAAHLELGMLYLNRGELESARSHWQIAVEITDQSESARASFWMKHYHSLALIRLDRAEEALPLLEELSAAGWRHFAFQGLTPCRDAAGRPESELCRLARELVPAPSE